MFDFYFFLFEWSLFVLSRAIVEEKMGRRKLSDEHEAAQVSEQVLFRLYYWLFHT